MSLLRAVGDRLAIGLVALRKTDRAWLDRRNHEGQGYRGSHDPHMHSAGIASGATVLRPDRSSTQVIGLATWWVRLPEGWRIG